MCLQISDSCDLERVYIVYYTSQNALRSEPGMSHCNAHLLYNSGLTFSVTEADESEVHLD